jgi:hypothetical protein
MKNKPLAKKLLKIIGYRFIKYKLKDNSYVLVVSPVKRFKRIIDYINGKLRTSNIIKLTRIIILI